MHQGCGLLCEVFACCISKGRVGVAVMVQAVSLALCWPLQVDCVCVDIKVRKGGNSLHVCAQGTSGLLIVGGG